MRTRPALTACFYLANARLYNSERPEFNVEVNDSEKSSGSESESDNPVKNRQKSKLSEILKRKKEELCPIMPSDSDDPEAQKEIISWHEQKRLSRLAKRRLKSKEKKSSMTT